MKKVQFEKYGCIEIHEKYVVVIMKEGITVKPEYNADLIKIADNHFKGKLFGYITNRKNSYSVDPRIYFETLKIENLVAFAVVSKEESQKAFVNFEKEFLQKPFKLFKDLEDAKSWIEEMITSNQKSK